MRVEILLLIGTVGAEEMTPRVVGGVIASIKDWPFIAFVAVLGENRASTCGGSLISSQTVLTAAHCLDDITDSKLEFDKFSFFVLMGHNRFSKATMIRDCLDYLSHEKYDPTGVAYDIGILFLMKPVEFSVTVKKAILMRALDPGKDREFEVAGWGAWSDGGNEIHHNSPMLKQLYQPLYPTRLCLDLLNDDDTEVAGGVICAGHTNSTEYAFSGDSGGPMAKKGSHDLAGVVSFRLEAHGLTVYSSVPFYYSWIKQAQMKLYNMHCLEEKLKYKNYTRVLRKGEENFGTKTTGLN